MSIASIEQAVFDRGTQEVGKEIDDAQVRIEDTKFAEREQKWRMRIPSGPGQVVGAGYNHESKHLALCVLH